jgi:phosphoglycerate dehydrogenase-like enzyme
VTDEFWDRNIVITSAYGANAIPVAEYTLSQIIFGLKGGYRHIKEYKGKKNRPERKEGFPLGCYKTTVGIISLGMIGRLVCGHLKHFDMNVIVYDPFAPDEVFSELGAKRVDTLEEIFELSAAVSLHTPWLPETEGMITGAHFESMKQHAVFINTSRGAVVNEKEMTEVLKKRGDIQAILDVTWPEPPVINSPLYTMDNVILTPHIAGTMESECARMGQYMVDELKRYIDKEPLTYSIDKEKSALLA